MSSPVDVGPAADLARQRAHGNLAKRQRVRSSAAVVDTVVNEETVAAVAPTTTAAPVRVRPTRSVNTVAPPVAVTESSTAVPVVTETPVAPTTTRVRNPVVAQTSSTAAPVVDPAVTTSSTAFASLAPAASSSADVSGSANNSAAHATKALLSTGAWIGVIAGGVALIALIAGFFIFRCVKRRREAGDEFGSFGVLGSGKREKDDDSFVTEGSPAPLFPGQGEKYGMSQMGNSAGTGGAAGLGSWNQQSNANNFNNRGMQSPTSESGLINRNGNNQSTRYSMQSGVTSGYGTAPLNSPVFRPPPMAAMMNAPPQAMRQSVANPYGAIAAQGMPLPSPIPLPQMPQSPTMGGDESGPFADPAWAGKVFKVTRTFEPTMGDELVIYPGDRVQVLMAYDDGWVLGENLDSVPAGTNQQPQRGVFPRDCVEELIATPKSGPAEPEAAGAGPKSPTGANLQRAPTLPKMEFGSSGFDESAEQQDDDDEPTSPSGAYGGVFPAGPTIQISSHDGPDPAHLSTTSSLNQASDMIDHFPTTPSSGGSSQLAAVKEEALPIKVKRTSSLIASRDADLFMALGEALDKQDQKPASTSA